MSEPAKNEGPTGKVDMQAAGRELIRSAARWITAAFAGIGAVLVAGTQVSSLGALDVASSRFRIACVGLATAGVGLLAIIALTAWVLLPKAWTLDEFERWARRRRFGWKLFPHRRVIAWFDRNPGQVDSRDLTTLSEPFERASGEEREEWRIWISTTLGIASYRLHISQAILALSVLPLAAVMVFSGLIAFTWAANPPAIDTPSLRNADLVGANLEGVNLDGMDLTGADLTGASLRGASLDDAVLKGVVWKATVCPDGTNSTTTARSRQGGRSQRSESCAGHLHA